jgi:hypothetical protein
MSPDTAPNVTPEIYKELGWDKIVPDFAEYLSMTIAQRSEALNSHLAGTDDKTACDGDISVCAG